MKNKKKKTLIFEGLGFPIKLINVPMVKECGEWYIDLNMNQLMIVVLEALAHRPAPLSAGELAFIRSYLQMTATEFGSTFGVSHVAVLKWESGENKISPPLELCMRLFILDHLRVKDSEFRLFYKDTSLQELSRGKNKKIHPLAIDATTEELKVAL